MRDDLKISIAVTMAIEDAQRARSNTLLIQVSSPESALRHLDILRPLPSSIRHLLTQTDIAMYTGINLDKADAMFEKISLANGTAGFLSFAAMLLASDGNYQATWSGGEDGESLLKHQVDFLRSHQAQCEAFRRQFDDDIAKTQSLIGKSKELKKDVSAQIELAKALAVTKIDGCLFIQALNEEFNGYADELSELGATIIAELNKSNFAYVTKLNLEDAKILMARVEANLSDLSKISFAAVYFQPNRRAAHRWHGGRCGKDIAQNHAVALGRADGGLR